MARRFPHAAAFLLLLPVIAATKSGINQVTALRAWSNPGSTRVIIETSGPVEYKADRATSPDRLFFDILRARPWINNRRLASRSVNDHLVTRVRVAETSPDTTRIVFDLVGAADFKVTRLDTPDRLVIELTPHTAKPKPEEPGYQQVPISRAIPEPEPLQRAIEPTSASGRISGKSFVPPYMPPPARPVISLPPGAPPVEAGPFIPFPIPDSWISLANVRMPRKAAFVSAQTAPSANTTTKVLPPTTRPAAGGTARASSDASQSLTRALGLKINRIVIDAGHGGHDEGTSGPNHVLEKDVVLDVALRLATLVQTRLGAEVVLTRSDDTFVPLTERTAIANEHKADLFLSIHANSSPATAVAGTETFLLNLNSSPGAIATAARENAGSDKSVSELRDLVQTITLNDKIAESQSFAAAIQSSIFMQAAKSNAAAHDRGVKKAPFVVLIGARMPSVLAEIGFLSNPRDESNLNKPEYRQKIAESLYRGIAQYSQSLSHFEVAGTTSRASSYSANAK